MNEVAPRLAPGIGRDGTYTRGGQAVAFVLGLVTMVAFLPGLFLGALLYTAGESRFAQDPERARKLVTWSWLSISALPAVAVLVMVVVYLLTR